MDIRPAAFNLALALAVLAVQVRAADDAPSATAAAPAAAGTLVLYTENNNACSLPIPEAGSGRTVQYEFAADESPCRTLNGKVRSLVIGEMPSAVRILMTDDGTCRTKDENGNNVGDFWIEVRTTAQGASTEQTQLTAFPAYRPRQIIARGLQLVDSYVRHDNASTLDRMSCVRISVSAATLTDPAPAVTLMRSNWQEIPSEEDSLFKCANGQAMSARAHFGDETKLTQYRCSTPMQAGEAVQVGEPRKSQSQEEHKSYFVCPLDTVITGREHEKKEEGRTWHFCAPLTDYQGKPLQVVPQPWSSRMKESDHTFECPGQQVLIGRRHEGDENGDTWYRCGQLLGQPTPRP